MSTMFKEFPLKSQALSSGDQIPSGRGGSWNADGTIIFSPDFQSVLAQISASGRTPKAATVMDASKHDSHRWPYFLPDGKHFLYLAVIHGNVRDASDGVFQHGRSTPDVAA